MIEQPPDLARTLFCGDNLPILQTRLASESVDLIYLDPPFYSQRNYQAFFKKNAVGQRGQKTPAFIDIWRWDAGVEQAYHTFLKLAPEPTARLLTALRSILGAGSLLAYLLMVAERLVELHRVLKRGGSVYLHCDPTASHYLKLLMDAIFSPANFRNEIVWCYKTGGASRKHFARKHDLIFFYSKSDEYIFHPLKEKSYMMHRYGFKKSTFLRDDQGDYTWVFMKDVWEIPALGAADGQRLGYPTQKPEILLERIIEASSREGEIVLDPFCGSGTTLAVAQRLGRGWLGIESHYLGVAFQRYRLAQTFPKLHYRFVGGPSTLEEARGLARRDPARFRWWVLALVCARPLGGEEQEVCELESGGAHGILSQHAGQQARFLVVIAIDPLTSTTLQHMRQQDCIGEAPGILLVSLEPFDAQLLENSASLEIVTIEELLQRDRTAG
jgi:site-specific DNA-methyltransferase (adenine-specific)